ncbi:hypothetical protein D3C84_1225130 [compost metagenome]
MIEAIVVDDDPVEGWMLFQRLLQRGDIRLPRQHRFDSLLWVFIRIASRQGEGFEPLGVQAFEPMTRK